MAHQHAGWRSVIWTRWIGWTIVYGLIVVGSLKVSEWFPESLSAIGTTMGLVLIGIAAFLIGTRFPSRWWIAGPPVVMLIVSIGSFLQALLGPQELQMTSHGPMTPRQQLEFWGELAVLFYAFSFITLAAVAAVPAYIGVHWGAWRDAKAAH